MPTNNDGHRHADIYRRIEALEAAVARIHDSYPTDVVVTARLATLQEQIGALRRDTGQLENRVDGAYGRIDSLREAWREETTTKRNLLLTVAGTVLAGVLVTLLLNGLGVLS